MASNIMFILKKQRRGKVEKERREVREGGREINFGNIKRIPYNHLISICLK